MKYDQYNPTTYTQRVKDALKYPWNFGTSSRYLKTQWRLYELKCKHNEKRLTAEQERELKASSLFIGFAAVYRDCMKHSPVVLKVPRKFLPFENWIVPGAKTKLSKEVREKLAKDYCASVFTLTIDLVDPLTQCDDTLAAKPSQDWVPVQPFAEYYANFNSVPLAQDTTAKVPSTIDSASTSASSSATASSAALASASATVIDSSDTSDSEFADLSTDGESAYTGDDLNTSGGSENWQ